MSKTRNTMTKTKKQKNKKTKKQKNKKRRIRRSKQTSKKIHEERRKDTKKTKMKEECTYAHTCRTYRRVINASKQSTKGSISHPEKK